MCDRLPLCTLLEQTLAALCIKSRRWRLSAQRTAHSGCAMPWQLTTVDPVAGPTQQWQPIAQQSGGAGAPSFPEKRGYTCMAARATPCSHSTKESPHLAQLA
jgi:hypothetical protein